MTMPEGGLPAALQGPEAPDAIRASCDQHGEYYARALEAAQFIAALSIEGIDEGEIARRVGEADPMVTQTWESTNATDELYSRTTTAHRTRLLSMLTGSKTAEINTFADTVSDEFIANLGRKPDMSDLQNATMFFALAVAQTRRGTRKPVASMIESAVVNQFCTTLLAKADPTLLCLTYAGRGLRSDVEQYALGLTNQLMGMFKDMTGHDDLKPEFLASKLLSLWLNAGNALAIHSVRESMPEIASDEAELREQSRTNARFAGVIQRVRHYGIKPVIFNVLDVVPGYDAVYHEFADLNQTVRGEQPMAFIRLVPQETPAEEKVVLKTTDTGGIGDSARRLELDMGNVPLVLDGRGELFLGLGISNNAIPLRILFGQSGSMGQYEELRSTLLSRLFDAVAPATVVERLARPAPQGPGIAAERPKHESSSALRRLMLPRVHYVDSMKLGDLRKAFDAALAAELAENEISDETRPIAPYLRNLPVTCRGPSDTAIELAKKKFGDDFELPPGKTFVSGYDLPVGRGKGVVGYEAAYRKGHGPTNPSQPNLED